MRDDNSVGDLLNRSNDSRRGLSKSRPGYHKVLHPSVSRVKFKGGKSQRIEARHQLARLKREESQALTRAKLLESARIVVAREGYETASIDRITEEAGFSKGAFYSNFQSKEEIFLELLEKHSTEDIIELTGLLEKVDEPLRIISIVSEWAAFRSDKPEWGLLALELFMRARRDATFGKRHTELFRPQWKGLGRILLRMFPEGRAPATGEALGALVFELTYGASSGYTSGAKVGGLVKLTLTALYMAHGQRGKSQKS